jgi:hypothetical protein
MRDELRSGRPAGEADEPGAAASSCQDALARLRGRLASLDRDHQEALAAYAELEREVAEVTGLYVALERLHGGGTRPDVLAAIQDVVINIVGSEELAVFAWSEGEGLLRPVQAFGVPPPRLAPVRLGEGPVGRAAARREAFVVGDAPAPADDPDLTACVPLCFEGRLLAVVAVWRMLPQKPRLGDPDRKVLELLGRHGGPALALASLSRAGLPAALKEP